MPWSKEVNASLPKGSVGEFLAPVFEALKEAHVKEKLREIGDPTIEPFIDALPASELVQLLVKSKLFKASEADKATRAAARQATQHTNRMEEINRQGEIRKDIAKTTGFGAMFGDTGEGTPSGTPGNDLAARIRDKGISKADFDRIVANPDLMEKMFPGHSPDEIQAAGAQIYGGAPQQPEGMVKSTGREALEMAKPFIPGTAAQIGGKAMKALSPSLGKAAGTAGKLGGVLGTVGKGLNAGALYAGIKSLLDLAGQKMLYEPYQANAYDRAKVLPQGSEMPPLLPTGPLDISPERLPAPEFMPPPINPKLPPAVKKRIFDDWVTQHPNWQT